MIQKGRPLHIKWVYSRQFVIESKAEVNMHLRFLVQGADETPKAGHYIRSSAGRTGCWIRLLVAADGPHHAEGRLLWVDMSLVR